MSWPSAARADESFERRWIVGVGGAGELETSGGGAHAGANVMIEWEAIEGQLEIEADVSALAGDGVEVPIDLLVKRPFQLSRRLECMIGAGPEIVHTRDGMKYGGEAAVDFMYWPTQRAGAWVEPSYDLTVDHGAAHALGVTIGVMIGW